MAAKVSTAAFLHARRVSSCRVTQSHCPDFALRTAAALPQRLRLVFSVCAACPDQMPSLGEACDPDCSGCAPYGIQVSTPGGGTTTVYTQAYCTYQPAFGIYACGTQYQPACSSFTRAPGLSRGQAELKVWTKFASESRRPIYGASVGVQQTAPTNSDEAETWARVGLGSRLG